MFMPYCPGERAAWEAGEVKRWEAEPSSEIDLIDDSEKTPEFLAYCRSVVEAAQARIRQLREGGQQ